MMHKKTLLYIGIFLCFLVKANGQNNLIINLSNNTIKGIALNNIDKITFSAGNMVLNKVDVSFESILLTDVRKITFGTLSGTNSVLFDDKSVSVFPNPASNYITIKNPFSIYLDFSIFSLDGRQLIQKTITSETETTDISYLSNGIYLLKMNGFTTKLIKR